MIYSKRFTEIDRKSDISVTGIVGIPKDEMYELGFRYIDVCIKNDSNKSISFEAELKVFKSDNYDLVSEGEAIEILHQIRRESGDFPLLSVGSVVTPLPLVHYESNEDHVLVSSSSRIPYRISQNDKVEDFFSQYLLVRVKRMEPINGLIVIRSDQFSEGPLMLKLLFDIPNISL